MCGGRPSAPPPPPPPPPAPPAPTGPAPSSSTLPDAQGYIQSRRKKKGSARQNLRIQLNQGNGMGTAVGTGINTNQ